MTFSSGDGVGDTACATFGIINDNNFGFDHEFTVSLSSVAPTRLVILLSSSSTTVNIQDDDGMYYVMLTFSSI